MLVAIGCLFAVWGCANVGAPTGGPRDIDGPQLLGIEPPAGSVHFRANEVEFQFDEFLASAGVQKEVFVSPIPALPPQVQVVGKRLRVRFQSPLLDSTTYVMTIGTGIGDANEQNKLAAPIVYAFSTGPRLDSGTVTGHIVDAYSGKPAASMAVLLFAPDSVRETFVGKAPLYVSQTDTAGRFTLPHIRPGQYRILAVADKDRSYTWNQPTEAIGVACPDSISLADGDTLTLELTAFLPDTLAPRLQRWRPVGPNTYAFTFSEPLLRWWPSLDTAWRPANRPTPADSQSGDSTAAELDTLASEAPPSDWQPQSPWRMSEDSTVAVLYLPNPPRLPEDTLWLRLWALTDTVGNQADTLLAIYTTSVKPQRSLTLSAAPPGPNPLRAVWYLNAPLRPEADSLAWLALRDTAGKLVSGFRTERYGNQLTIQIPAEGLDSLNQYFLVLDTQALSIDSLRPDSLIRLPINPPRGIAWSGLSGGVRAAPSHWLLTILDDQSKPIAQVPAASFALPYLEPGKYQFRLLDDRDQNQRWTTGRMKPWRTPERVHLYPDVLELRPNWEIEDFMLDPPIDWK
jgi:hypothetical protein